MKTTAIVSLYKSYPPESGAASVSFYLSKYFPGKTYLIQLCHDRSEQAIEYQVDQNTIIINALSVSQKRAEKLVVLLSKLFFLAKLVARLKPDIIVLEGASWTVYYIILLKLFSRMRLSAKVIYHSHNVEYLLRKNNNNCVIAKLTKYAEKSLFRKSDLATVVSENDSQRVLALYGANPVILPNGVDIEKFDALEPAFIHKIKEKYNLNGIILFFMGLAGFPPTEEGLNFLMKEVLPQVRDKNPNVKLALLGGNFNFKENWIINPGVIPFEEVPAFISISSLCLAPIFSGSGTRIKILEYLAAGRPVVSTKKGAEGLALKANQHILYAENPGHFVSQIQKIIDSPKLAQAIGDEGRRYIRKYFSWKVIVNDFLESSKIFAENERGVN